METRKTYHFVEEEKFSIKQKFGKCFIPFRSALFCLDCYTIYIQSLCPNCLSSNSVRLIELFLSEPNPTDAMIKQRIRKKILKTLENFNV